MQGQHLSQAQPVTHKHALSNAASLCQRKNKQHKNRKTHTATAAINRMWLFNLSFTRSFTSSSVCVCRSVVPCPTSSSSHPRLCCHGSKSWGQGEEESIHHMSHLIPTLWMCAFSVCKKVNMLDRFFYLFIFCKSLFLCWVSVVCGCPYRRTVWRQFVGSSQSSGKAQENMLTLSTLIHVAALFPFFVLLSLLTRFSTGP